MTLLDEHKCDVTEGEYIQMCNLLKDVHEVNNAALGVVNHHAQLQASQALLTRTIEQQHTQIEELIRNVNTSQPILDIQVNAEPVHVTPEHITFTNYAMYERNHILEREHFAGVPSGVNRILLMDRVNAMKKIYQSDGQNPLFRMGMSALNAMLSIQANRRFGVGVTNANVTELENILVENNIVTAAELAEKIQAEKVERINRHANNERIPFRRSATVNSS